MKKIITYVFISRMFLVVMALFCLTIMPLVKNRTMRGNVPSVEIYQGDRTYLYNEPKSIYQDMWSTWDSKWYISIAEDGYSNQQAPFTKIDNKGFMPLYALLIWFVSTFMLFGNSQLAGFLISNIFLILSLYFLKKFIDSEPMLKSKVPIENVWLYILFFPTSYFLSSVYPESLFLFLSVLTLYLINIKKIGWASLCIGLAFITKVFGMFLVIPLLFHIFRNRSSLSFKKILAYAFLTAAIPFAYLLYMHNLSGDAFAYIRIQELFFGHSWTNPIISMYEEMFVRTNAQGIIHGGVTIFAIIVLLLGFRSIRIEHWVYSMAYILFTPLTGMVNGNARYAASLFFVPIILSIMIKKEGSKLLLIHMMSFIQGLIFIWWLIGAGFTS